MPRGNPETYLTSLLTELDVLYAEYSAFLESYNLKNGRGKLISYYNFLTIQNDMFRKIEAREKVFRSLRKDFSAVSDALGSLRQQVDQRRSEAVNRSRHLMNEIRSVMNTNKEERRTLSIPRSQPRKKESVPSLIDIKL